MDCAVFGFDRQLGRPIFLTQPLGDFVFDFVLDHRAHMAGAEFWFELGTDVRRQVLMDVQVDSPVFQSIDELRELLLNDLF
jgi:hypothetical protein